MKRILISLCVAATVLALVVAWFFHSRQESRLDHSCYHSCKVNRELLEMARYWYALDNGMTNAPALEKEALASYIHGNGEYYFTCPTWRSGTYGTYSVNPTNQYVVCTIHEHMLDTCKDNHSPSGEHRQWLHEFPLNYRNSEYWWQSMDETKNGTILRMSGATIIFKGLYGWGKGGGSTMDVSRKYMISHGSSIDGERVVSNSYASGTYTMSFTNHTLHVIDCGRTLELDGQKYDLSQTRPRIIVETNGFSRLEGAIGEPNKTSEPTSLRSEVQR